MKRDGVRAGATAGLDFYAVSADDWRELGLRLREAGYATARIRRLLKVADPVEEILANTGRYAWQYWDVLAQSDEPVSVLGRLFLFCGHVPSDVFDGLGPALTSLLRRLKLVQTVPNAPGSVRAVVGITEFRQHYFLSDTLFERLRDDFVVHADENACMPPHASSLELFSALRKPDHARSFLDVGCGSGCQSLLSAAGYERVAGYDPSSVSVRFARANAALNGVSADYTVDGWESFHAAERFDHVAFNTPNAETAFAFVNEGLDAVLSDLGHAQIWLVCEVVQDDGSMQGTLRRNLRNPENWQVEALLHKGSPLALPQADILARRLPYGTLLVGHPSENERFFQGLAERHVIEIVSTTLTIRRR